MASEPRVGLADADPQVGQTLQHDGVEWEVTDHSSYWDAAGYRVTEWCCESEDEEAYLLKEIQEGNPTRWFFTRRIPAEAVTVAGGASVAKHTAGQAPPPSLTYEGQSYRYTDKTEGTYEDEPGQRTGKTTWEYWDAGHVRNLAVEVWADGRIDCYRGAYIDPAQVRMGATAETEPEPAVDVSSAAARAVAAAVAVRSKRAPAGRANPFVVAAVAFPFVYAVPFLFGRPFDESLVVAFGLAGAIGWLVALVGAPRASGLVLLAAPAVAASLWRFHPLTSGLGWVTIIAAPAVTAWVGRTGRRIAVLYAAATATAAPALGLGAYYYFGFAPTPHRLDQLGLALGPALVSGVIACVVAGVVLARAEGDAS